MVKTPAGDPGIFGKKKRRIIGEVLHEGEIRTKTSWLSVHSSSRAEMATYESSGLVVALCGSGTLAIEHAQCREAGRLAEMVTARGGIILNGGRSAGIMGAAAVMAKGSCASIIFPEIEKDSSEHGVKIMVNSPQPRIELLATCAPVIVLFRGGLGTLMVLMRSIVHLRNRQYHPEQLPQLIFVSNYWIGLLQTMMNLGALPHEFLVELNFFNTADDIIKKLPPA